MFFNNNDRFADVINVGAFQGEKILLAQDLEESDGFSSTFFGNSKRYAGENMGYDYLSYEGQLKKYVEENKKEFSNIKEDAYDMLGIMTNSKELVDLKEKNKTEKDGINMCEALKQLREEGKEEGKSAGIAMSVITILQMKGEISDERKSCILAQKDEQVLNQWLQRAVKTENAEAFFSEI